MYCLGRSPKLSDHNCELVLTFVGNAWELRNSTKVLEQIAMLINLPVQNSSSMPSSFLQTNSNMQQTCICWHFKRPLNWVPVANVPMSICDGLVITTSLPHLKPQISWLRRIKVVWDQGAEDSIKTAFSKGLTCRWKREGWPPPPMRLEADKGNPFLKGRKCCKNPGLGIIIAWCNAWSICKHSKGFQRPKGYTEHL